MKTRPKSTIEYNVAHDIWVDQPEAISLLIQLMGTLPATDVGAAITGWREEQQRLREAASEARVARYEAQEARMNTPG